MAWRGIVAGTSRRVGPAAVALLGLWLAALPVSCAAVRGAAAGPWRGWLESPGGDLPFGLLLSRDGEGWEAKILNGEEIIQVPEVSLEGRRITFSFPHYASEIRAELSADGEVMAGEWTRRSGPDTSTRMVFHARHGDLPRFSPARGGEGRADPSRQGLDGRWRVRFATEEKDAVGLFRSAADGTVAGTFLTTAGDHRYLAGTWQAGGLRLSCFDGAHAFLFHAELEEDGSLTGDFWSRDTWHETWTAEMDDAVELADGFQQTRWTDAVPLEEVTFPDLEGAYRSLADPSFLGRARIIEVFGTWCPNCNDAASLLTEYHQRFGPRGLSILGLAFEMTGEFGKDAEQVRRYVDRYSVPYPILVAGTAPKDESSRRLPVLDRIRSYPTFIFLDGAGEVEAVYSGFSGPAAGESHQRLRQDFEALIEKLLGPADADPSSQETRS